MYEEKDACVVIILKGMLSRHKDQQGFQKFLLALLM